jgi:hypothetical protein
MDLEYQIQTLMQTQTQLADQGGALITISTDLDPDSPESRMIEAKRQKLQVMDKKIQAELVRYQGLLKMAEAEMQSAEQLVDKAIQRNCSYGTGGGR